MSTATVIKTTNLAAELNRARRKHAEALRAWRDTAIARPSWRRLAS